jgi:hypothetical protein
MVLTKLVYDGIGLEWFIMGSVVDAGICSNEHSVSTDGGEFFE